MLQNIVEMGGVKTDTGAGVWNVSQTTGAAEGAVTVVLTLFADHPYVTDNPSLVIRCDQGKTEFVVRTGHTVAHAAGSPGATVVQSRFDEQSARSERWGLARDNTTISPPDAMSMARQLAHAKQWRVEYQQVGHGPTSASFRPARLAALLTKIDKSCQ